MTYLQTVEIDGLKIVRSFDAPPVDPQRTKKIVNELMTQTEEFKAIKSAGADMRELYVKRSEQMSRLAKFERGKTGAAEIKALKNSLMQIAREVEDVSAKIAGLQPAMKKKYEKIYENHLVRSAISGCEEVGDEIVKTLSEKLSKLVNGQYLTTDGDVVEDNRGKEYFHRDGGEWHEIKIERLGQKVPNGALLASELTSGDKVEIIEQRQRKVVSAMPDSERLKDKSRATEKAIMDAAIMKSGYEIEGRDDPGGDARAWLESRKKEIEALYG
jgi:DNA-directed RNA polymerase subunit F